MPLHLKTAEANVQLITEPSSQKRYAWLSHAIYRAALIWTLVASAREIFPLLCLERTLGNVVKSWVVSACHVSLLYRWISALMLWDGSRLVSTCRPRSVRALPAIATNTQNTHAFSPALSCTSRLLKCVIYFVDYWKRSLECRSFHSWVK